eukprot:IDg9133t1
MPMSLNHVQLIQLSSVLSFPRAMFRESRVLAAQER